MNKTTPLKLNWADLSLIYIGVAICLPALVMGQKLGQSIGFLDSVIAIFLGNFSICFLGFLFAKMAIKTRQDTIHNAAKYLGESGTRLFGQLLLIQYMVWVTIQLNMIYQGMEFFLPVEKLLSQYAFLKPYLNSTSFNFIIGGVISLICLLCSRGLDAIKWIFRVLIPILIATLFFAFHFLENKIPSMPASPSISASLSFWEAISIVVGGKIVDILNIPNFYRSAHTQQDGRLGIFFSFIIGMPLIEVFAAYIGSHGNSQNILAVLSSLGGSLWHVWLGIFFFLAGLTTNIVNFYNTVELAKHVFRPLNKWVTSFLIAVTCVYFSQTINLGRNFTLVLKVMSILSCSMGSVIFMNYIINSLNMSNPTPIKWYTIYWNEFSWFAGSTYGILGLIFPIKILGIDCLDSFIFTALLVIIGKRSFSLFFQKKSEVTDI